MSSTLIPETEVAKQLKLSLGSVVSLIQKHMVHFADIQGVLWTLRGEVDAYLAGARKR